MPLFLEWNFISETYRHNNDVLSDFLSNPMSFVKCSHFHLKPSLYYSQKENQSSFSLFYFYLIVSKIYLESFSAVLKYQSYADISK